MLPISKPQGLYRSSMEHDNCGVGFVANIEGKPSNKVLVDSIDALCRMAHRGALDADKKTGDGAGVLTQLPIRLIQREIRKMAKNPSKNLGVGMFFLPQDNSVRKRVKEIVWQTIRSNGLILIGWRLVPVDINVLGAKALDRMPKIEQVLIGCPDNRSPEDYEKLLFSIRSSIESRLQEKRIEDCYIPSLSSRTIVYKGMLNAMQLRPFYPDLRDPLYETGIGVVHQRYSTNTFPAWKLAHPFRMLAHNGEINTIYGNRHWSLARQPELSSTVWPSLKQFLPILKPGNSDSANLDNMLEMIVKSGRDLPHALSMLIPIVFKGSQTISKEVQSFYQFHQMISDPWDGPAAVVVSDGQYVASSLDRNGLRPIRYKITKNNFVFLGSEAGIGNLSDDIVIKKGRLGPGEIILVDTIKGKVLFNNDVKEMIAKRQPYEKWIANNTYYLVEKNVPQDISKTMADRKSVV